MYLFLKYIGAIWNQWMNTIGVHVQMEGGKFKHKLIHFLTAAFSMHHPFNWIITQHKLTSSLPHVTMFHRQCKSAKDQRHVSQGSLHSPHSKVKYALYTVPACSIGTYLILLMETESSTSHHGFKCPITYGILIYTTTLKTDIIRFYRNLILTWLTYLIICIKIVSFSKQWSGD